MTELHSKNFKLSEFTNSSKAKALNIDNTKLTTTEIVHIANLITNVLQPARDKLGFPITITSGFRCDKLNSAVGGVSNSQHRAKRGAACDLRCFYQKEFNVERTRKLFEVLSELDIDQLLYEKDKDGNIWVHVSYVSPEENRHMIRDNYLALK